MGKRVIVVGGSGFIGQHVVRHLALAGAEVTVIDLYKPKSDIRNAIWISGTAADEMLLASVTACADTVIFLANNSVPGSADVDLANEVRTHVGMAVKSAEICAAQGVKRFLFASSGGTVYGSDSNLLLTEEAPTLPRNAYGVSKLAIEHYLRILGDLREMTTLSLRISNPYGEGQTVNRNQGFIAAAMQHSISGEVLPIWGDGTVERDFIHISDVADAFVKAASYSSSSTVINIGSGKSNSLLEVLKLVEAAVGREVPVTFGKGRSIDVKKNTLDISRAAELLAWRPSIKLSEGLARTADWWRGECDDRSLAIGNDKNF